MTRLADSGVYMRLSFCYPAGVVPRILLLDNNDSFTFLLADRLRLAGSCDITIVAENQAPKLMPDECDALIISPGPGLPAEHPASLRLLAESVQRRRPCLGVCLGFQMIALHFGARLMQLKEPRHGVAARLNLLPSYLTRQQPYSLQVGLYHSWAVDPEYWPATLRLLGEDSCGIPMALEHSDLPLWGVQFHPESILCPQGLTLLQGFLEQIDSSKNITRQSLTQHFDRDFPLQA